MIKKFNLGDFVKYILIALCSAIVSYFTASCTSIWVKGHDNSPVIDVSPKLSSDSTNFINFSIKKTPKS